MVGGAAREKVVVLDAVQMGCLLQQVVDRVVVSKWNQDMQKVCAHRAAGDVQPTVAHRVDGHHPPDAAQLVGRECLHVLARARDAEAVAGERCQRDREGAVQPVLLRERQIRGLQAEREQDLRREPDQPALLGAGHEVGVGQRGPAGGTQVGEEVLLEDLFAGRVVVRAGTAPGVVVRHQDDAVLARARHGEQVVPAGRTDRERGKALALDDDARGVVAAAGGLPAARVLGADGLPAPPAADLVGPVADLGGEPGDELLHLALVAAVPGFGGELAAVAADVFEDGGDPVVHWSVARVHRIERPPFGGCDQAGFHVSSYRIG